jgi:hypothetical protein
VSRALITSVESWRESMDQPTIRCALVRTARHGLHTPQADFGANNLGGRFALEYRPRSERNKLSLILIGVLAAASSPDRSAAPSPSSGRWRRHFSDSGCPRSNPMVSWLSPTDSRLTTVLLLIPAVLGEELLGDTWSEARELILPVGCQFAAIGLGTVGFTARRMTDPRRTLPIKLVGSAIFAGVLVRLLVGGIALAAWGLLAGSAIQGTLAWVTYLRRRVMVLWRTFPRRRSGQSRRR